MTLIYLDNNATTPIDPQVFAAMQADLGGLPLNPSSVHSLGQKARQHLQTARKDVATFFGFHPEEVIFTSGGTESINLFLRSLPKGHILTSSIEHSAIDETLKALPSSITRLPVDLTGAVSPEQIQNAIRPDTLAIVLSASNTETGVKIDLPSIAQIALAHRIPLFIDAVSYVGKELLTPHPGITAIAISGHKFHGPKGIGALLVRSSFSLSPLITGGGQERMRRSGTENLAGILGLAEAIRILSTRQSSITAHIHSLRDHFEKTLQQAIPDLIIQGQGPRICNVSNLAFPHIDGETLLLQLDLAGVAASHGSACSSGALEPSRVLLNMGLSRKQARSSLRFSFSRMNTLEEVERATDAIIRLFRN